MKQEVLSVSLSVNPYERCHKDGSGRSFTEGASFDLPYNTLRLSSPAGRPNYFLGMQLKSHFTVRFLQRFDLRLVLLADVFRFCHYGVFDPSVGLENSKLDRRRRKIKRSGATRVLWP